MAKGTCPACRAPMNVKHRFCAACGKRSPLFPARRGRPPATAGKAAGLAPVADLGAARRAGLGAGFYREADPARREALWDVITKSAGPQHAAVYDLGNRADRAWAEITAEADPGRRQVLYESYFGSMTNGGGAA